MISSVFFSTLIVAFFPPQFLTEHGYNGTLSAKTLQSPSTKEFVKMLEFIYCQLEPTFVMPNSKIEEEIPAMLKSIG